jgi:PTS system nitrogen regulatory IIA component
MEIRDFLSPDCAVTALRVSDKNRLLLDLAQRAATMLGLPAEQVSAALLKREELGSTGTGGGVAIPHARLPGIGKPFGLLARLDKAIDFDAVDGRKVDVVFLLLLPANAQGEQLNALAAAARALRDPDTMRNVRGAADGAALYRAAAESAKR